MRVRAMKWVDEVIGPWICLVFCGYHSIAKMFFPSVYRIKPAEVRHILLIKFFGMGSIILATPMMRALRQHFPQARLIMLTFPENFTLCQRLQLIDEVVTIDPGSFWRCLCTSVAALRLLRQRRGEIAIDLEFFAKATTLMQYLSGAKVRVGYFLIQIGFLLKMMWRGNLLTHNVYYNSHRHTVEAFLALSRSIGADTTDTQLQKITILDDDRRKLAGLLAERRMKENQTLVVMNINASPLCLERRWPLEYFVQLTEKILAGHPVTIVLIGSVQDAEYVGELLRKIPPNPRLLNLAGALDIGMLASLCERAILMISNDSGPLHLAASLGVPTVSFFGPETPQRFGPTGENHTVFYAGVYCSPCLNVYNQKTAPCDGQNECMRKIPIDQVYAAISQRHLQPR